MKKNNYAQRHMAMIKRSIGKNHAELKYDIIANYEEYLN